MNEKQNFQTDIRITWKTFQLWVLNEMYSNSVFIHFTRCNADLGIVYYSVRVLVVVHDIVGVQLVPLSHHHEQADFCRLCLIMYWL